VLGVERAVLSPSSFAQRGWGIGKLPQGYQVDVDHHVRKFGWDLMAEMRDTLRLPVISADDILDLRLSTQTQSSSR
jgi:hypothetical protein